MILARFIAQRFGKGGGYSRPVVRIAIATIALSLAVMLLSVGIVTGFKEGITHKMEGIGAHIQIAALSNSMSFETQPVHRNPSWLRKLKGMPGLRHVQVYATKPTILKTKEEIQGVLLKGVASDYDWSFLTAHLVSGSIPEKGQALPPRSLLISKNIAKKLRLEVGDSLSAYYVKQGGTMPRGYKMGVHGIYASGVEEMDQNLLFSDLESVQAMYDWSSWHVSGIELMLTGVEAMEEALPYADEVVPYELYISTLQERYPDLFQWLPSLDQNAQIILVLMIVVSLLAMSSTLLILILERTQAIGLLKALGMRNGQVRAIFWFQAARILWKGMLWGNFFGLGLALLQHHFKFLGMDPETYYLDYVPVALVWFKFLLINLGTMCLSLLVLVGPTYLITRISVIRALRFH